MSRLLILYALAGSILVSAPAAQARNSYFAMFVPMSLQNLGYSSANTWVGDCANCHRTAAGGQVGVPDLNAMFGRDFYAFVSNTGADFTQAQVQMIIQGIEGLDSDNDGATNFMEYRGRTNPNNPLSRPAVQGDGGRIDDPNEFFPPGGDFTKSSTRVVTSDEMYGLSGCGAEGFARAGELGPITASLPAVRVAPFPYVVTSSIAGLWLLPILLLLFERRRKK